MTREEKDFVVLGVRLFSTKYKEDFNITINDLSVTVFWHEPSLNLGWYPIVQMEKHTDKGWRVIFHQEGPENPNQWRRFSYDISDYIEKNIVEE